jgi:hypothetical protein
MRALSRGRPSVSWQTTMTESSEALSSAKLPAVTPGKTRATVVDDFRQADTNSVALVSVATTTSHAVRMV